MTLGLWSLQHWLPDIFALQLLAPKLLPIQVWTLDLLTFKVWPLCSRLWGCELLISWPWSFGLCSSAALISGSRGSGPWSSGLSALYLGVLDLGVLCLGSLDPWALGLEVLSIGALYLVGLDPRAHRGNMHCDFSTIHVHAALLLPLWPVSLQACN